MKKVFALLLVISMLFGLCSCGLIRKISPSATADKKQARDTAAAGDVTETDAPVDSETETETSSDIPGTDPSLKISEDQAYELLTHSFPDYEPDYKEYIKIERTGAIIAENDGTEYYIFNVSLPIIPETVETQPPAEPETDEDGNEIETETETETETAAIELEEPVPYYVSVNGVVHDAIGGGNVDTKYAEETFEGKYGTSDPETGFAYKLVYEGLLKSDKILCYSFAVYKVDGPKEEYAFNYLVTIDGKMRSETTIQH